MPVMTTIASDRRPISGIYGPEERWQAEVGKHIEKIEGYFEDGDTPWFALYRKGEISQRINAAFVECVTYKEGDND